MEPGGGQNPVPPPEPQREVLEAGPGRGGPFRRGLVVVAVMAAVAGLAVLTWQLWPRSVAPLTLTELEGVYAGMVRGDGTNDASLLRRPQERNPSSVTPKECLPLFDTTAFDRFPDAAVDGVGTFWMAERVGTSLATFRFGDAGAASQAYERVNTALATCDGQQIRLRQGRARSTQVSRTPVTTTNGAKDQLGYLYGASGSTRFAVHVLRFENTVTWQFRYDSAEGDYSPLPGQQVMDSLVAQIRSVVDLRS